MDTKRDNWPRLEMVLKSSEPTIEPVIEPTIEEKIAKAIKLIFLTHWALNTNPPAIRYQNVPFKQPANGEWISFWIHYTNVGQVSLGTEKVERQIGTVYYIIVTPKNIGDRRATEIADMISLVFDGKTFTLNSDKSITTIQNGEIVEIVGAETGGGGDPIVTIIFRALEKIPIRQQTNYFQLNASVPYLADYI